MSVHHVVGVSMTLFLHLELLGYVTFDTRSHECGQKEG
jgi:hypothetical protein